MIKLLFVLCLAVCSADIAAFPSDPFASEVTYYNPGPGIFNYEGSPYLDTARCLHEPMYGVEYQSEPRATVDSPNNDSVVTLGDRRISTGRGVIVLKFAEPITDDSKNPYGLDFIVFSNAYFIEGDPSYRWQELAFVEISQDNTNWYLILPSIYPANLVGGTHTGSSIVPVSGYAEYTPTVDLPQYDGQPHFNVSRTPSEFFTIPERPSLPNGYNTIGFDYVSGGGDAFDIASAVLESAPGVPVIVNNQPVPAGIGWFQYVRLTDAVQGDSQAGFGELSAEIDAAAAVHPTVSIGETKMLPQGGFALITEAIVTGVFTDDFFIESPDRSAAIRVSWDSSTVIEGKFTEVGDKITITGHISKSGGKFMLPDPMFSCTSIGNTPIKPLGMPIKSLSADLAYGLTVRTWGEVTNIGDGHYCIITDGDSSVKVVCEDQFSVTQGAYKSATGICDREEGSGATIIRLTDPANITTIEQ